ncbi:MAG: 3-dehydroquinate synthase, partial [Pseudomonadota bacterium]|nr:3-dehydroquinate synthase [Pseudomonadota bacterium]
FGHTFAHALENILGYGKLQHGEAVAIGMILAAKLSPIENYDLERLETLIKTEHLPHKVDLIDEK